MARGRFITFEGGEGCGKSTQTRLLAEALARDGVKVLRTREPGGTWLAEEIRRLLKDQSEEAPCDRCELLLFLAARAQLVKNVIRPALEAGVWVLSDRFSDSTVAYQGYGRGLSIDILRTMDGFACEGLRPDLTVLLEVTPETARQRLRRREQTTNTAADRIELAGEEFHRRLRRGFAAQAAAEPERIVTVDANRAVESVQEAIWTLMRRFR